MTRETTILLTGGTGLLGSELLQNLLKKKSKPRVLMLVRGNSTAVQRKIQTLVDHALCKAMRERVEIVSGDLQQEGLGLDPRTRAAVTERITHVIHAAASISFAMPYEMAHAVNYDGTRRVYELAAEARNLEAFAHISTTYVAGRRTGMIREEELNHDAGFVNDYERTKYEAELFLRSRMSSLPIAVYRTATMIGNSVSGAVRQFNYFHDAIRSIYLGLVPSIPGNPNYLVEFIPEDWAAEAIRHLVLDNFRAGETYHLCAGATHALALADLIDTTCRAFADGTKEQQHTPPRILAPDEFRRMLDRIETESDARHLQLPRAFRYFVDEFTLPKVFDSEHLSRDLLRRLELPDARTFYSRVVAFCLETRWGRARRTTALPEMQIPALTQAEMVY